MKLFLSNPYITTLSLAIIIYLIRISGFWIAGYLHFNYIVKAWLDYLPGCIMMAIVAPSILHGTYITLIGSAVVVTVMYQIRSLFLAMFLGVGVIMIINYIFI